MLSTMEKCQPQFPRELDQQIPNSVSILVLSIFLVVDFGRKSSPSCNAETILETRQMSAIPGCGRAEQTIVDGLTFIPFLGYKSTFG
jgi:hypothetical protein